MKKIIAFDLSSGDKGSIEAIDAAIDFCVSNPSWKIIGYSLEKINKKNLPKNLEIVICSEIIEQDDSALEFKRKKDSTLVMSINAVKDGIADGLVSAAASGPLVAGTYLSFKTMANLRPAYAAIASSPNGDLKILLDAGANMGADAKTLNNYALMGSEFAKAIGLSDNPIVKQLNIGEEEKKGTELQKEAFLLMKNNEKINFQGNIEANRVLIDSDLHVVVAEAFSGNIVLKAYEGAIRITKNIIKESMNESFIDKLGFALTFKFRKKLRIAMNEDKAGGAIVLGLNNLVVKAHGSSDASGFLNSLYTTKQLIENDLIKKIKEVLE